jgi:hypothetical protein
MLASRDVQPEWLDQLPADDARAIRSRRDLVRINRWMLQAGIMAQTLRAHHGTAVPRTICDLGSGDGKFMLRVARLLAPRWRGVTAIMLDRQNIVDAATREAFESLGWSSRTITGDVFDIMEGGTLSNLDIITANLFLHHFPQPQLTRLLTGIAMRTPLFVACEPRRAGFPMLASRMLWAIGCNDVSRHDAAISVQAGFTGTELAAAWPSRDGWHLDERAARLFTHRFVAQRIEPGQQHAP